MKKMISWFLCLTLCFALPACSVAESSEDLFSDKDKTVTTADKAQAIVLDGQTVTIDQEGSYAVSGQIDNGSLRISLQTEGTVYLLLNGVTITNESGAALYTENCKKVIVTLAEGTVNTLTQGSTESEEEAALLSKDDLTINGTGALVVNGGYKDGINSRDSLKIVDGQITVTAQDDGLVGKDAVIIGGGEINITAACDGIKSTNEEDEARGYVTVAGGNLNIVTTGADSTATGDSAATTDSTMTAGEDIPSDDTQANDAAAGSEAPPATEGASLAAPGGMEPPQGGPADGTGSEPPAMPENMTADGTADAARPGGGRGGMGGGKGGMGGGGRGGWEENTQTAKVSTTSAKGIKAYTIVTISGGTINIQSTDDALHGADVTVSGGTLSLSTGDDGIHADDTLTISGGVIEISQSYEGLEGAIILLSGGEISLVASDDGVNAAGGDSGQQTDTGYGSRGFGGFDMFSSSTGSVTISGGILKVTASGDGLDSNGDVTMTGGQVYINGPTNSGNGALDYDSSFTMTGGTLIAIGAAGMAQGVSNPSVAGTMASVNGSQGTLQVMDSAGNVVLSMEAVSSYQSAVIYSDLLTDGGSYTLYTPSAGETVTMSTSGTTGGWGHW